MSVYLCGFGFVWGFFNIYNFVFKDILSAARNCNFKSAAQQPHYKSGTVCKGVLREK